MTVRKEAIPYAMLGGAAAAFLVASGFYYFAAIPALFMFFTLFFFRDPVRVFDRDPDILVSPADGKVIKVGEDGENFAVSIFMSVMDVHINRSPVEGKIAGREYFPGCYLAAYHEKASAENERLRWTIDSRFGRIVCTQIAGLVARRIHPLKMKGEDISRGQEFGLIAFGSRVDMLMPKATTEVLVKVGDRVKSGISPVARGRS